MKVNDFIKQKGVIAIWNECNQDPKIIKKYILINCDLPSNKDISQNMRSFFQILRETKDSTTEANQYKKLVLQVITKLRGENK